MYSKFCHVTVLSFLASLHKEKKSSRNNLKHFCGNQNSIQSNLDGDQIFIHNRTQTTIVAINVQN